MYDKYKFSRVVNNKLCHFVFAFCKKSFHGCYDSGHATSQIKYSLEDTYHS